MFGVPLIVSAQLIRIVAFILEFGHVLGGRGITLATLAGASIVIEIFGFLDLSYRTRGAARAVARSIAVMPLVVAVVSFVCGALGRDPTPAIEEWAYTVFACLVVAALWLASSQHHVLAGATAALVAFTNIVPRLHAGIIYSMMEVAGRLGIWLLVFGPPALVAVLAWVVGRTLPTLRIEPARIVRTLRRAPISLAPLAVAAILVLAGGAVGAIDWLGALGNVLLAITGYRTRTRSVAAFVPCIVALLAMSADGVAASHDRGEVAVPVAAALFAAPFALVAVHARYRYAVAITALAIVAMFAAWNAAASTSTAATVELCHVLIGATAIAACIIASFALRAAARVAATTPEPTVAEVFA
jgi:hypothetical protein